MNKKQYHVSGTVKIFPLVNPWIYVGVPKKHTEETRRFARRGLVPITVKLGKSSWETSLLPKGDGTHFIALNAKVRKDENIEIGNRVKLTYWTRTR